jgi:hypothetical protein
VSQISAGTLRGWRGVSGCGGALACTAAGGLTAVGGIGVVTTGFALAFIGAKAVLIVGGLFMLGCRVAQRCISRHAKRADLFRLS